MFAVIDCNNFFVSCERVFRPDLWYRPVVVLSNNDGCIISRSNEAKELGIKMGHPLHLAQDIINHHNVEVISSGFALYGEMSRRVVNTIETVFKDIEIYSIDEVFVDLSNVINRQEACCDLRNKIFKWTGIPVSIGIGKTKTLAKLAVELAKKRSDLGYVYCIFDEEQRTQLLKNSKVEDVWGIGRKWSAKLRLAGVGTAYEFCQKPDAWVRKEFSVIGLKTAYELKGIKCFSNKIIDDPKKSITYSRSFGTKLSHFDDICEALSNFTERAAKKLRKEKRLATAIIISLRNNPFSGSEDYYKNSIYVPLEFPTDHTDLLIKNAKLGLKQIFKQGLSYKKCGITMVNLVDKDSYTPNIFNGIHDEKKSKLMRVIDECNSKNNSNYVKFGSSLGKELWKGKSGKNTSNKLINDWGSILKIKLK